MAFMGLVLLYQRYICSILCQFESLITPSIRIYSIYRPPARRAHALESLGLGENHNIFCGYFHVEPYRMVEFLNHFNCEAKLSSVPILSAQF